MAAITANNGGIKFLKNANGKMYLSTDTLFENPIQGVEGKVIDLNYKVITANGAEIDMMDIDIKDEAGDTFRIGIGLNSPNYNKVISLLKSADLTKTLQLHSFGEARTDAPGKFNYNFGINQNGEWMKSFYKKGDLPQWNQVKINGKNVWDRGDFNEALKKVVLEELVPMAKKNAENLSGVTAPTSTPSVAPSQPTSAPAQQPPATPNNEDGGLPF